MGGKMLLLLQEGPADTAVYMIAGYAVIFTVMAIYLISLIVRSRNLRQDLEVLNEMDESEARELEPNSA